MTKKHWFYKTLFSYLPIFFFVTSTLFLIFFLAFSEHIKETALRANLVFGEQVSQAIDNYLKPIDQFITKEIVVGDSFRDFLNRQNHNAYTLYEVSHRLNHLTISLPIASVYIFHQADELVISNNMVTHLQNFTDKNFILSQLKTSQNSSWTGRRMYQDQKRFESVPVVSLVRKVPFNTGEKGLIVVNLSVDAIEELVQKMSSQRTNHVSLYDSVGNIIFSTESGERAENMEWSEHWTEIRSQYSGWVLRSGIRSGGKFAFFSAFPYVWVSLGFICMVLGTLLIIYVTRRNYRPIEAMIHRINGLFANRNGDLFAKGNQDEMRFIEMAIENLLEQSNKFQNQYQQDLIHIRRNFFIQLLEGNRPISLEECKSEMRRLGKYDDFHYIHFAVMEIDKYAKFCETYSDRDQYLLKFALNSVMNEIAQNLEIHVWTEWVNNSQLGIIYLFKYGNEMERDELVRHFCNKALKWVGENLHFTITFGIGGAADNIPELPHLYEKALKALKYKPVLGNRRIIHHGEAMSSPILEIFHHVQLIQQTAQSFRLGEVKWKTLLARFFDEIKTDFIPKDDMVRLIQYMIFYLDGEVAGLSEPVQKLWKEKAMPALKKMLDEFETLEEFQTKTLELLSDIDNQISFLRESKMHHDLIHEVKKYISENYANPDLSLIHLSDEFHLSSRYLSRIFKDEFGEKFVDYLMRIRIEHAMKLLQETEEPVHEIALKVGYLHPFSFIRVFKRMVGITPGDFRKKNSVISILRKT